MMKRRRTVLAAMAAIGVAGACTTSFDGGANGGSTTSDAGSDAPSDATVTTLPDGATTGFALQKPAGVSILRGTSGVLAIDIARVSFDADVIVTIADLPDKVVPVAPATTSITLGAGQTHASFPIQAASNSALGPFPIKVTATSVGLAPQNDTLLLQLADPPGSIDLTFGGSGLKAVPTASALGVVVQADGAVVVGGSLTSTATAYVRRYAADGTDDTAFNTNVAAGLPSGSAGALAIRTLVPTNPQIVVAGRTSTPRFFVQVYNHDGTLDTTFNTGTFQSVGSGLGANAVTVDGQQRIIAVGENTTTPGPTGYRFATNGTVTYLTFPDVPAAYAGSTLAPRAVVAGANDEFWIAGALLGATPSSKNHAFLAHFDAQAKVDAAFGTGGIVVLGPDTSYYEGRSLARFPTGELGIGGTDGTSKCTFGIVTPDGKPTLAVDGGMLSIGHGTTYDFGYNGAAMQVDGRIVLAGSRGSNTKSHPFYERRFVDGGVDLITDAGVVDYTNGSQSSAGWNAAAIAPDGRIVLAGTDDSGWIVARYWP